MNIVKFLNQDVNKQIERACKWGLRLHFLASDLRSFANAVNTKDIEELNEYHWFKHHFMGGSSAGEGYKTASNENYNALGFCIRETQSDVLNTTQKTGNSGADLITGRALLEMQKLGLGGLTTKEFHTKEGGFHCEHNFQVNNIKVLLLNKILSNNKIDPLSMVRFVVDHSLVVTVHNTERKDGGDNLNNNIAPFWRYANVGANVLQFTDDGFEEVTNCTIQEVNSNRWNRNAYFQEFRAKLENISRIQLDTFKEEIYNSTYNKEPKSSTSPVLNDTNLDILVRNDAAEIATNFYPDKFKDRWKKA
jgi:hypothetical protein